MSPSIDSARVRTRLTLILVAAFIALASVITPTRASAADAQIADTDYQIGDLYSSVIYSLSGDVDSADGVEMPFDVINRYPGREEHGLGGPGNGTPNPYGRFNDPGADASKNALGSQLENFFRTMYDYGWFEPMPREETGAFGWTAARLSDAVDSLESKVTSASLSMALVGASVFDTGAGFVRLFESAITALNIPSLLGLGGNLYSDNWLTGLINAVFTGLGFNAELIKVLQSLFAVTIAGIFLILLVFGLRHNRFDKKEHLGTFKKWGSRGLVMLLTLPLGMLLTQSINVLNVRVDSLETLPADLNESYIVDTLDWAVYGNMNWGFINPAGTFNSLSASTSASPDFAPTPERIENLRASIAQRKSEFGVSTLESRSATDLLQKYISGETSNVNDYLNGIAGLDHGYRLNGDTSNGRSATNTRDFATGFADEDEGTYYKSITRSYFFSPRENTDETLDTAAKTQSQVISIAGQEFKITLGSGVNATEVTPRNPRSYIYGATPSENLSPATRDYANFIYDSSRSKQLIDPETGDAIKATDTSEKAKAIRGNAVYIGIMNRYYGMTPKSLSDQSTTFFLQTVRSGENSINYKGYNTVANSAGESKNTGRYGNTFVRYTMPAESAAKYYENVGSLSATWLVSGILSLVVAFTLLRVGLLGALMRSFTGFIKALVTGNFVGLIDYVLYYAAIRFAFLAATAALYVGAMVGKYLFADNPIVSTLFGLSAAKDSVTGILNPFNSIPTLAMLPHIMLAAVFVAALCWPFLQTATRSGKIRKVSLISAIIMLPFIIAESISDRVKNADRHIQGSAGSEGVFGGRLRRNTRKNAADANRSNRQLAEQEKQEKQDAKGTARRAMDSTLDGAKFVGATGAKLAGAAALTAATGGAGAGVAASMVGRNVAKGAVGSFLATGAAGKGIEALKDTKAISKSGDMISSAIDKLTGGDGSVSKMLGVGQEIDGDSERLAGPPKTDNSLASTEAEDVRAETANEPQADSAHEKTAEEIADTNNTLGTDENAEKSSPGPSSTGFYDEDDPNNPMRSGAFSRVGKIEAEELIVTGRDGADGAGGETPELAEGAPPKSTNTAAASASSAGETRTMVDRSKSDDSSPDQLKPVVMGEKSDQPEYSAPREDASMVKTDTIDVEGVTIDSAEAGDTVERIERVETAHAYSAPSLDDLAHAMPIPVLSAKIESGDIDKIGQNVRDAVRGLGSSGEGSETLIENIENTFNETRVEQSEGSPQSAPAPEKISEKIRETLRESHTIQGGETIHAEHSSSSSTESVINNSSERVISTSSERVINASSDLITNNLTERIETRTEPVKSVLESVRESAQSGSIRRLEPTENNTRDDRNARRIANELGKTLRGSGTLDQKSKD